MANESRKTKLGLKNDISFPKTLAWEKTGEIITTELGLKLSPITVKKRLDLYKRLDPFTNFWWGGNNAFSNYGAFIIADKRGDLKASVGPSFSNNYTKPQFESSAGQLQGITFNTFQIRFKIGLYWISDDHYRKFLKWFDPYKIDFLKFGYDEEWSYQVKLASISEGTKYILGQENNIYNYYIETDVVFDIVGENCACGESYNLINQAEGTGKDTIYMAKMEENSNYKKSLLDSDFTFSEKIKSNSIAFLDIVYDNDYDKSERVFYIQFNENGEDNDIFLQYDSSNGLIYWSTSNNPYKLLTLQQLYKGERLVKFFKSQKIKIPGTESGSLDYEKIKFVFGRYEEGKQIGTTNTDNVKIKWRPKINII